MKTSRTHRTPKAEATERAAEAVAIADDTAAVEDDTARERARQAAREAASEAKAKREAERIHRLKIEVNQIIDTRERALRIVEKVVSDFPGTVIDEDAILCAVEYHGIPRDDARIVLDNDGGRWDRWNAEDGTRYVKKY